MRKHHSRLFARTLWALPMISCLVLSAAVSWAQELTIYVSPGGSDAWSGSLAEPSADGKDGPLASIQRARDILREKKEGEGRLEGRATVVLREGVYGQTEEIVFTPADSGTVDCPISYRAYPGETPVLSGGNVIQGWEPDDSDQSRTRCDGKLWRTAVPAPSGGKKRRFNALFINDQRRTRARHPNKGAFFRADGPISKTNSRGFFFKEGDLERWERLRDAVFVVYHSWETSIHHVRSLDTESCQVTFWEPAPWPMGRWEKQQRYYVENVFEALDEPGEWYLNRGTNTLYYYPLPGEKIEDVEAVAPLVTSTLIRFQGDIPGGRFVEHLHFNGLSFLHTNANLKRVKNPGQGEIHQPGMIMAEGLRNSSFERCRVAHAGAHAIWLAAGCEDDTVRQCHLHDLAGGGVYIGGGWGLHEQAPAQRNTVDNSFIHDGGHLFHGAHGVWIGRSSYNKVTHNEISNFDYSGISCGWSWGFQPSSAHHNNLDYNHIHHLSNGEGLSDMGAIYTLGVSPGTTERYNHMHHVYSYAYVSHGSGVYPDEGSSGILVENNVVYRVRNCPLFQHYGKDNIIRNNILALGDRGQIQRCREDKSCHYEAVGNIIYADIEQMLGGVWESGDWKVGKNVYWSTAGEPKFGPMDFEAWKVKGQDEGSIVADPLFVDPENDDFRLKPDSPALALGFQPIDLSKTGLYGDEDWVDLPEKYPNRPLNEIPGPEGGSFVVHFDFEADELGTEPLDGQVVKTGKQALAVSDDTAASGNHCLKFVDEQEQPHSWTPHIYYHPNYDDGTIQLSWDMLNSGESPASFYVEVRQWDVTPYRVGPTVSVGSDGSVTASGQHVGTAPSGQWVHVDIEFPLGLAGSGTYQLTLTVPNRDPVTAEIPYLNEDFERVTWLGISSTSNAETVFYMDNLKLGTPEQLTKPPKRRAAAKREKRSLDTPANDQQLMAHWKFDNTEGYVAEDISGYGNDGDVWASWVEGDFGSAIFCDPAGSVVLVPDSPSLRFGTSDFTIGLWICPTELEINSDDARRRFLQKDGYPRTWWNVNISSDGRPFLEMTDANGNAYATRDTNPIPENAWTHLVIVADRGKSEVRYYYNGAWNKTHGIPADFTGPLDVTDGDLSLGSSWHPFIGLLDEVEIYRRVLSEEEIRESYEGEKANRAGSSYKLVD